MTADTVKVDRRMKTKNCYGVSGQRHDLAAMEAGAGGYAAVKNAVVEECGRQEEKNSEQHRAYIYKEMENKAIGVLVESFKDDANGQALTEETENMDSFAALQALLTRWGGTDDTEVELSERKLDKLKCGGDLSVFINDFVQLYNRAVKKGSKISIAVVMGKLLGKIPKHHHVRIDLRKRLRTAPLEVTWGVIRTEYVTAEREAKLDEGGSDSDSDSGNEMKIDSKPAKSAQATTTGEQDRLARLEGLVASLVETLAANNSRGAGANKDRGGKFTGKCFGCGKEGHRRSVCRPPSSCSIDSSCTNHLEPSSQNNVVGVVNIHLSMKSTSESAELHLDNCANIHVLCGKEVEARLFNVRPAEQGDVILMNSHPEPIKCYGDLEAVVTCAETGKTHALVMKDCAVVPSSSFQLLSVSKYLKELQKATGRKEPCVKTYMDKAKVPLKTGSVCARQSGGLYSLKLEFKTVEAPPAFQPSAQVVTRGALAAQRAEQQHKLAVLQHELVAARAEQRAKQQHKLAVPQHELAGIPQLAEVPQQKQACESAAGAPLQKQACESAAGAPQQKQACESAAGAPQQKQACESAAGAPQQKQASVPAAGEPQQENENTWGDVVLAQARQAYKVVHARFGHGASLETIKAWLRAGDMVVNTKVLEKAIMQLQTQDVPCEHCMLAATNKIHPSKTRSAQQNGMWTMDFSTNLPRSRTGKTIISVWVAPKGKGVYMKQHANKSEFELLKTFRENRRLWEKEVGEKIDILRTDHDSAFGADMKSYLSKKGIRRSITTGRSGGAAEGTIRQLQDKGRAMLNESGLPDKYLMDAMEKVVVDMDKIPGKDGLSRYERREGEKPRLDRAMPFGATAFAHIPQELRRKGQNRGRRVRILGELSDGRGYKVLDEKKGTVFRADSINIMLETGNITQVPAAAMEVPAAAAVAAEVAAVGLQVVPEAEEEEDVLLAAQGEIVAAEGDVDVPAEEADQLPGEEWEEEEPPPLPKRVSGKPDVFMPEAYQAAKEADKEQDKRARGAAQATDYVQAKENAERLLTGQVPRDTLEAEASADAEHWRAARQEEEKGYLDAGVMHKLPKPMMARKMAGGRRINNKSVIGSKWVYDIQLLDKDDERTGPTFRITDKGQHVRYKARKVARGDRQRPSDYSSTYAATPQIAAVRMVLAFSLLMGMKATQLDVKQAFLQAELPPEEQVYMTPPTDDYENAAFIYLLMKSVYGLRQAAYRWSEDINKVLQKDGFEALDADTCVYTHRNASGKIVCVLALHVDDMLLVADDSVSEEIVSKLKQNYTMSESPARWFLKMKVEYAADMSSVTMSQPDYAEEIIKQAQMEGCNPVATPLDTVLTQGSEDPVTEEERLFMADKDYGGLVGMVAHYSLQTRPDLAQAVGQLQRFTKDPRRQHWHAVQRVIKYIAGTKDYGLRFTKEGLSKVVGASDSDWASSLDDRQSTSGYVFLFMGAAIAWKSKKQPTVARSTAEAELIALDLAVREALWLRKLCQGLDLNMTETGGAPTITVYEDNEACYNIAQGSRWSNETKHVDVKYFAVREDVARKRVAVERIATEDNPADLFTKALGRVKFEKFRAMMGVVRVAQRSD
jgi:hypothetical protein